MRTQLEAVLGAPAIMKTAVLFLAILVALTPLPLRAQEQRDPCAAAATDITSATKNYEYEAAAAEFDACADVLLVS